MADISKYLSDIESSIHGDDIRDAIIQAIEAINQSTTVQRLNGMLSTAFVTKDDFDKVAPLLSYIDAESEKGVQSNAIYSKIIEIINTIDRDINKIEPEHSTIYESIADAISSVNAIREAIMRKEVSLSADAPLSRYATAIRSIYLGSETVELYDFQSLSATENKTYYAGKNGDGKDIAYRTVNVQVEPTLMSKRVTELPSTSEEFVAANEQKINGKDVDGYSSFELNISSQVPELNISDDNLPAKLYDVKELEFIAKDVAVGGEKALGFSKVTVDVRNKVDSLDIEISPDDSIVEDTYNAEDGDGVNASSLYGYDKVTISVSEGDGPFTVYFYGDETDDSLLYTVENVEKHSFAVYGGSEPTKNGYQFTGWNPLPVDVTSDLKCYAQYEEDESSPESGGGSGQKIKIGNGNKIISDWNIIENSSPDEIPLGATKKIYVDECVFGYEGVSITLPAWTYTMTYVGYHYGLKTWISDTSPYYVLYDNPIRYPFYYIGEGDEYTSKNGWETSKIRELLNGEFLGAITAGPGNGQNKPNIVSRGCNQIEYTPTITSAGPTAFKFIGSTTDSIWLLSQQERGGNSGEGGESFATKDYTPGFSTGSFVRTAVGARILYVEKYQEYDAVNKVYVTKYRTKGSGFQIGKNLNDTTLRQLGVAYANKVLSSSIEMPGIILGSTNKDVASGGERYFTPYTQDIFKQFQFGFCTP